jgi:hypothetical protein
LRLSEDESKRYSPLKTTAWKPTWSSLIRVALQEYAEHVERDMPLLGKSAKAKKLLDKKGGKK